jgi:hypothetical protein
MDNVQNVNHCIKTPSSQTLTSYFSVHRGRTGLGQMVLGSAKIIKFRSVKSLEAMPRAYLTFALDVVSYSGRFIPRKEPEVITG